MKRILVVVLAMTLFCSCATLEKACEGGDAIKARIRAMLQITQVGYPLVVVLANQTVDPNVIAKVQIVDASLDILGKLAYDIVCPTVTELNTAQTALEQAQVAKAGLGVK